METQRRARSGSRYSPSRHGDIITGQCKVHIVHEIITRHLHSRLRDYGLDVCGANARFTIDFCRYVAANLHLYEAQEEDITRNL